MTDTAIQRAEPRETAPQIAQADPLISMIERVVLDPDADIDKMERLLAMKERVDAQRAKVDFSQAIAMARAEIPPIIKDATVDFTSQKGRTHYKHETLAGIAKQIDPILSQYGLSYRFRTGQGNGGVSVTCIISHCGGYSEETTLTGSPDTSGSKNSFQAVGSAVTYLQRYTLKAALGLSAEVDDDGRGAGGHDNRSTEGNPDPNKEPEFNPRAAADRIITAIRRRAGDRPALMELWKGEKVVMGDLPIPMFDEVKTEFAKACPPKPAPDLGNGEIPY